MQHETTTTATHRSHRGRETRFPVKDELSPGEVREGLSYVTRDGLATQAMVTLTGGILLVAFALELGASNTVIGLLAAIPPLAELFQIPSVYLVEKIKNRRLLVVANSLAARAFWLVIAAIPFLVPRDIAIAVLIAAMFGYATFSAVSHCSWNSWMRDLVPQDRLGSFFSQRMMLSTVLAIVLSLFAAFFIDGWEGWTSASPLSGYSVLFLIGYGAGMVGVFFLAKTPEPRMIAPPSHDFFRKLVVPVRDLNFRNLLIFLGSWNFAVNLAAPFFTVYMLKRLDLDLSWVIALSVLSQLVSVAAFRVWGRASDRFSNKSVLKISGPLFMICILAWTFTTLPDPYVMTIPLLIGIHVITGISTAGVNLASSNIGLKLAPQGQATTYLAASIVINSIAAAVAPVAGGLCVDWFAARELSLILTWTSPVSYISFETLDLKHWDFFFAFAFAIGLYSLHRLSHVRETGEVEESIFVQELFSEAKREMRNLSTVGGLRLLHRIPFFRMR
jgi:MFS family permease